MLKLAHFEAAVVGVDFEPAFTGACSSQHDDAGLRAMLRIYGSQTGPMQIVFGVGCSAAQHAPDFGVKLGEVGRK